MNFSHGQLYLERMIGVQTTGMCHHILFTVCQMMSVRFSSCARQGPVQTLFQ